MSRTRLFEPGVIYSVSHRVSDGRFLFAPNHDRAHPLLAAGCPVSSLSLDSPIVPVPSVINIIGSAYARAQAITPVSLHWVEGNINHIHDGISAHPDDLGGVPTFYRNTKSLIARQLNALRRSENQVFGGRYRMAPCLDDAAAEGQWLYGMTNAVKDGLAQSVGESPFFSTYDAQVSGKVLEFWWIDWSAYWQAGGKANRGITPNHFLRWSTLEVTPLPSRQSLSEEQRRMLARRSIREDEQRHAQERQSKGRVAASYFALRATDPFARPQEAKETGPQPLCHAVDPVLRDEYRAKWREFLREYKRASSEYRQGLYHREFPMGSFRPPLVKIYTASYL